MNLFFIVSILINIKIIFSNNCSNGMMINVHINCYNEIILFNTKNYRAGHFAINNKGDMIVEYSDDHWRLFYGFKNNGRYFYDTKNNIKELYIENKENPSAYPRYESNNIFVYLENDINREKGYLLSISSYISATELYDLENNNYTIKTTKDFIGKQISGFIFPLIEVNYNNTNIYFCIFNHGPPPYNDKGKYFSVKKFALNSFDLNTNILTDNNREETYGQNIRIISSFIMEEDNILIVFYMFSLDNSEKADYYLNFYDFNLNQLAEKISINMKVTDSFYDGVFFKGIYLQKKYAALIYFKQHDKGKTLYLEILDMKLSEGNYGFSSIFRKNINKYDFSTYITMNEFLKVDKERLIYLSTTSKYKDLYILFFDLYNEYSILKTRVYFLNFPVYELRNEISACIYNNFLVFTGSAYYSTAPGIFSIFFIFGFPKGDDNIIDISPYIYDSDNYNSEKNLVNSLLEDFRITNNLFSYEKIDKLRLSIIPKQILFYNKQDFKPLSEGDLIDQNYLLTYDKEILKDNSYYELGYQFVVKEPNYDQFYKYENKDLNYGDTNFDKNLFKSKIFYGRTNILKFKLCHSLCETCKLYGISNINQKCYTCPYSNDYNYFNTNPLNCLQEGYLQDNEEQKFIKCNKTNSKFYFDVERNKRICFKYDYGCPYGYTKFNSSTNECEQTLNFNTINFDFTNSNYSNDDLLNKIIPYYIENYDGKSNVFEGKDNVIFQITSDENELKSFRGINDNKHNLSVIDLANCEKIIRETYDLNDTVPLIILKYEKRSSIITERSVQYEVYNYITKEKLDISVCNKEINIFYPITLNDKQNKLYENLNNLGYDMFDINSSFYKDICTPYKTEDGTDILLSDRVNDIYNNNNTCPSNCRYSNYTNNTGYLTCECSIVNKNITVGDISNMVINSFLNVFTTLNYKFLKCYKLVFHINVITKNIGSIFSIILFCFYLAFFILYIIKGIKSLKDEVEKFVKKRSSKKVDFRIKVRSNLTMDKKDDLNNSLGFKKIKKKGIIKIKKKKDDDCNSVMSKKSLNFSMRSLNKNNKDNDDNIITLESKKKDKNKNKSYSSKKIPVVSKKKIKYTDFELNNLLYKDALIHDKRTLTKLYTDKLRKQQIIMFTFFAANDFNLIYMKIAKFIFDICGYLAMNVLFFFDESMHKIYLNYGKYDFIQQIPQILYSSVLSLFIDFIALYLIVTQKQIYEIIKLRESDDKENKMKIDHYYNVIRIKYILFFIFTFLIFVFYWYFIASFCAVYENTQIIFLKDFISSFITGMIYPFIISLVLSIFKKISLNDRKKKRCKFLYFIGGL